MKKTMLFLLTCIILLVVASPALAESWLPVYGSGGNKTSSPHDGLTTSSNDCKVCHAVHNADPTVKVPNEAGIPNNNLPDNDDPNSATSSYRLLRNSGRDKECNYCHAGASSASGMQVYAVPAGASAEHTVASIPSKINDPDTGLPRLARNEVTGLLPDSAKIKVVGGLPQYDAVTGEPIIETGANGGNKIIPERGSETNKFNCFHCHSVHGANVVNDPDNNKIVLKILRKDPAKDGAFKKLGNVETAESSEAEFCKDCHNKNFRPETDGQTTTGPTHPMRIITPDYDVYGETKAVASQETTECKNCHAEFPSDAGVNPGSKFPHQGTSFKFLGDVATNEPAKESELDKVCRRCHGTSVPGKGVGEGF